MQNFAYKLEGECRCVPHHKKMDKQYRISRVNRKKEWKEACRVIALVWTMFLAFAIQLVMPQGIMADTYSVFLFAVTVLQVLGW